MFILNELKAKEIRARTDKASVMRSKLLSTHYEGTNSQGTLSFVTESGTKPGQGIFWLQKIKLLELNKHLNDNTLNLQQRIRKATEGELKVTCDCIAFKYWGWAYIMTKENSKHGYQELRRPKEKNPALKGSVCKHLENALRVMTFNVQTISRDVRLSLQP